MTAPLILSAALFAAAMQSAAPTVCHDADHDKDVSVASGLDGFRAGETFRREFVRVGADHIIDAPHYFERYQIANDSGDSTYEIRLDDGQTTQPGVDRDWVNTLDGVQQWGATGTIRPKAGQPGGFIIVAACNAARNPLGNCRAEFGSGGADRPKSPSLDFFTTAGTLTDVCVTDAGAAPQADLVWTITIDGAAPIKSSGRCTGPVVARKVAQANRVIVTIDYPKQPGVTTLSGDDIRTVTGFMAQIRSLAYDLASPQHAWLVDRIAESKAAFAAAGGTLPPCSGTAPITRPTSVPTPAPNP